MIAIGEPEQERPLFRCETLVKRTPYEAITTYVFRCMAEENQWPKIGTIFVKFQFDRFPFEVGFIDFFQLGQSNIPMCPGKQHSF